MNKRIMIIEDDVETQFLFSEILSVEGYKVTTFESGEDALNYLKSDQMPDLIFMDLKFPKGTPEDFVQKLRQMEGGEQVTLVLVSGNSDIQGYAEKLKAKGHLKKPFDIDALLDLVHQLI